LVNDFQFNESEKELKISLDHSILRLYKTLPQSRMFLKLINWPFERGYVSEIDLIKYSGWFNKKEIILFSHNGIILINK
jgi:hypothetical protein